MTAAAPPPMRARRLAALALMAAIAALMAWPAWEACAQVALGGRLFDGMSSQPQRRLAGRLAGHERLLPPEAARCVNCHVAGPGSPGFGPPLHAGTLAQPLARRGGPPSTYDAAALCRLLREGIDPAWVLISQAMPRYDATDAQCAALWAWLMHQPGRAHRSASTPARPDPPWSTAPDAPT